MKIRILVIILLSIISLKINAEDGYDLWLRYKLITNQEVLSNYNDLFTSLKIEGNSQTINIAADELKRGLKGLLGKEILTNDNSNDGNIIIGITKDLKKHTNLLENEISQLGDEGYLIHSDGNNTFITGNTDVGVLYGVFNFLKLLQTHKFDKNIKISSSPKIKLRVLNHWDNLDRTVERGYSGFSIWDWHKLPDFIDQRYIDYARANASIGINGTVLTNVNSNALVLSNQYLVKVKALADLFRPYGIRVYLTARFSAPIEIGGLETADPLNKSVQEWWNNKADEIYSMIPDFGGFLVKANSEGQPGPQNYGRTHVEGANMLADALAKHNGVVMWRAFVYTNENPEDRAKQAYNEFQPFDGKFRENVFIQTKNGAIDFQPREPFHPLFGAMPKTPIMMEFQITQEYLGQGTQLTYLAPLYKECLDSDTYASGEGSLVAKVIDGSLDNHKFSGIAGVSNIGTDRNWTGHIFGQSNWYTFGRLAWDHDLSSEEIAEEWIRMTFTNNEKSVDKIKNMMLNSRENLVNYMTPLGLHHIMGWDHHYGPGPWIKDKPRADWTSVYYHKADSNGIGFDRTCSGSNALNQYFPEVEDQFSSLENCPEESLLWFHHLDWDYKVSSGRTLWDEMCYRYYEGASSVSGMQNTWELVENEIDGERFNHVKMLLNIQQKEANWWRDACVLYFQTKSKREIPSDLVKPEKSLDYYMNLRFPYSPGIKPTW